MVFETTPVVQTLIFVTVTFVASCTRSTFGFGEALVAMPLLSLVLGVKSAVAVVALNSLVNATTILTGDRQAVEWSSAWRLVLASFLGIPLGVVGLDYVDEQLAKIGLGVLLISFSLYNLRRPWLPQLRGYSMTWLCGVLGGVLGGAFNTMGPPLVIYGTLRRWPATMFRTTLQSVFLPANLFICVNHYLHGMWTGQTFGFVIWSIPSIFLGAAVGRWIGRQIPAEKFTQLVYGLLLMIGCVLIVTAYSATRPESRQEPSSRDASGAAYSLPTPDEPSVRRLPGRIEWASFSSPYLAAVRPERRDSR